MPDPFVRVARWATRHAPVRGSRTKLAPSERTLELAGLPLLPREVAALALLASLLGLAACGPTAVLLLMAGAPPMLALPLLGTPPILALIVLSVPESRAKRMRSLSLAATPEVVTYLAMSLRARPSLDRAIAFAAEHAEPPFSGRLRRVLWDVHLRTRAGIEDALTAFGDAWGAWNEELKRSLETIVHATREGAPGALPRALDRAREIAFSGARRRWRDYAASLRGPTTALFALGVLLPLIVGSMLPLLSLGRFAPTSFEVAAEPDGDAVPWIVLLDVVFPALTFALAHGVSSGRTGIGLEAPRRAHGRRLLPLAALPLALVPLVIAPPGIAPFLSLAVVLGGVFALLHLAFREGARRRRAVRDLEAQLPDALFRLGTRLEEGRSLEESLLSAAGGARDTAAGALLAKVGHSMRLGGGTLEDALFGEHGALRDVPSRSVRATMRMVVDLAAKDPPTAGRATLEMAAHLRDLQDVERDLRTELRPTVDAMRATATLFGPVVLGVTGSMYAVLARAFAGFARLPMTPLAFQVALAVYLSLSTAAILHFATRIERRSPEEFAGALARSLPLGYGVYVATLAIAGLAL